MSEMHSFYLLDPFQGIPDSKPEDWLARVVSDYRRPHVAYTPREARTPYFKYHSDPEYSNVTRVLKDISKTSLQMSLLDILGISHEEFKKQNHTFESRKVERFRIHHDATVLEEALKDEEVKKDIKEWGLDRFHPMYFVVGLLVTTDITYDSSEDINRSKRADVDPGKAAGMAFGSTGPVNPSAKIEVEQSCQRQSEAKTQASGKRVFAVEYRPFRKHLRQRPGKTAKLGGYGPQGDRTFSSSDAPEEELEAHVELDSEPFSDTIEVDGGDDRLLILDND